MGWFSFGTADIDARLKSVDQRLGAIVASLREVLSNITGWGTSWRDRALAAEAAATAEKTRGDNLQAALDAAIADDAVTDQQQIAEAVAIRTENPKFNVLQPWGPYRERTNFGCAAARLWPEVSAFNTSVPDYGFLIDRPLSSSCTRVWSAMPAQSSAKGRLWRVNYVLPSGRSISGSL